MDISFSMRVVQIGDGNCPPFCVSVWSGSVAEVVMCFNTSEPVETEYNIFEVKLIFEMLTVRGQPHSFSTHERMFLWKCQVFETENVST